MRKMTESQAELYIKAGYFPLENEIEAICDLQDVFGHQRYWATIRWLCQNDTKENAERLYRLIWHKDVVDEYVAKANKFERMQKEKACLNARIAELTQERDRIARDIEDMNDKMYWVDEENN